MADTGMLEGFLAGAFVEAAVFELRATMTAMRCCAGRPPGYPG